MLTLLIPRRSAVNCLNLRGRLLRNWDHPFQLPLMVGMTDDKRALNAHIGEPCLRCLSLDFQSSRLLINAALQLSNVTFDFLIARWDEVSEGRFAS